MKLDYEATPAPEPGGFFPRGRGRLYTAAWYIAFGLTLIMGTIAFILYWFHK